MRITSTRNPTVKFVRSLERAPVRQEHQLYPIEGVRLVHEAIRTDQSASLVLYDPALLRRSAAGSSLISEVTRWADEVHEVEEHVLVAACHTESPAGILAVLRRSDPEPLAAHAGEPFGIVLDLISDPGNAGTILRTAAAVGANFVVALSGSVDLFAPKVVRAGMGAHFRLPLYSGLSWPDVRQSLTGATAVALKADAETSLYDFQWPESTVLVVGSEAHGLSPGVAQSVDSTIFIPMKPDVESLNASVAASVVMYEALGRSISRG